MKKILFIMTLMFLVSVGMADAAVCLSGAEISGSCYADLETAVIASNNGDVIELRSSQDVGQRIDINSEVVINGNDFTLSPTFSKTNNSNNATLGIFGQNITIRDLTIEGIGGTNLHGINIYVATNILLDHVIVSNNDHAGIVVNGSEVTVDTIITSGNSWGAINVDLGGGVISPAILTVLGYSTHSDATHIWMDDFTKDVTLVDPMSQYSYEDFGNTRIYTLQDIISPIITFVEPTNGSEHSEIISLEATCNEECDYINFWWRAEDESFSSASKRYHYVREDGTNFLWDLNTLSAEKWNGDTYHMEDGVYYLYAAGKDLAGNWARTPQVMITVNNDPTKKDQCKHDGWMSWLNPSFRNQGDCVSSLQMNDHAVGKNKNKK